MKKINSIILLLAILLLNTSYNAIRTDIRINVRNELGNIESGVSIALYKTKADYEKSENAVFKGFTDIKGNVTFDGVEAISYYIGAEKGGRNNYGAAEKTEVLEAGKLNKMTIIISEE